MKRLATIIDRIRFEFSGAGWAAMAGLVLMCLAGLAALFVVPSQWAAARSAQEAAERSHQEYLALTGQGQGRLDPATALAQFRERLTPEKQADEAMEAIQRAAEKNGLALAGTDYKWQRQAEAKLAEVRIAVGLKAGYGPLRAFVRQVLTEVPGLALDQFELQRENIGSTTVDARLRFSLFLRMEP
jgi:hypothetical protein